jgi:hypothetical protein
LKHINLVCLNKCSLAGDLSVSRSLGIRAQSQSWRRPCIPCSSSRSRYCVRAPSLKSATTSEAMPSGFAYSTADSVSSRKAEESKRPGSGWSYKNESIDAQNTMQEIATQRKHLLSSQVATAQQHANATRPRPRRPYGRRVTRTARRSPKCRRRTRRSYPPGFPTRTCSRGRWPCCP